MKNRLLYFLGTILVFISIGTLLTPSQKVEADNHSIQAVTTDTVCRFGITSPYGSEGYDVGSLGVGSYLDWGAVSNPSLPEGVEYIRVLRLREDVYTDTLINLPGWVEANPGSVWLVGNEPDTTYEGQDSLLPEVYADRYYELATTIRHLDPTARIGFGSVVQPTPIRLRYLDRAWNELKLRAGSYAGASSLIDFWSIHGFILNEQILNWGTGVPPGFENDHEDAVIITDLTDTYSIEIFQQRISAFRSWMAGKGERGKPLWITEYGSLMPPIDPNGDPNYYGIGDDDTAAFMLATFDFMLSATDSQTGLPGDGNQLVQRWFWYSLNDHRYNFGGSIYNPDYPEFGPATTWVGEKFIEYQTLNLKQPDLFPDSLAIEPISINPERTLGNYRLSIDVGNNLFSDASCARVWVYDGNPDEGGVMIAGPIPSSAIQSAYGMGVVNVIWKNAQPLTTHTLYVHVESSGVVDTNPSNNTKSFEVFTELPQLVFLTSIIR
jgi:hypothetical protein